MKKKAHKNYGEYCINTNQLQFLVINCDKVLSQSACPNMFLHSSVAECIMWLYLLLIYLLTRKTLHAIIQEYPESVFVTFSNFLPINFTSCYIMFQIQLQYVLMKWPTNVDYALIIYTHGVANKYRLFTRNIFQHYFHTI